MYLRSSLLLSFLLFQGCGQSSGLPSNVKEPINTINNPNLIPGADAPLETHHISLDDSGEVATPIWDAYWYPYSQNGTARRNNPYDLSPMEKYDAVTNRQNLATNWELQQAARLGRISWAGHCNGLAAASTMSQEPRQSVFYGNINFTPDDIKALLIEAWQGGGATVGSRCDTNNIAKDAYGRIVLDACRDLNPATLHLALTNFIGRFRKPIIIDIDPTEQVWNYPAISYRVLRKDSLTARDANWWLQDRNEEGYQYNANAKSFEYYQTEISFKDGTKRIYEYILELDTYGYIIGGEWYGSSKTQHPDFVWRHSQPTAENPYIDVNVVYDIANRSL
jgi:hypothetical protein